MLFLGFSVYIMSSSNSDSFNAFSNLDVFYFFFLPDLLWLRFPVQYWLKVCHMWLMFVMLRHFPSEHISLSVLIINGCCIFIVVNSQSRIFLTLIFRERGREEETETLMEERQISCLSPARTQESNPWPYGVLADALTTESHWLRLDVVFHEELCLHLLIRLCNFYPLFW